MPAVNWVTIRSKASRVTRPDGPAAHQIVGISVCCDACDAAMKPATGMLRGAAFAVGVISASRAGPSSRPGQVSALAKSCHWVGACAKVLVSCWKPPMAIRMVVLLVISGRGNDVVGGCHPGDTLAESATKLQSRISHKLS